MQGERGDELRAAAGHDDTHLRTVFQESADQFGTLVGGDAAADAENDALTIQPLHRLAFCSMITRGDDASPGRIVA
ncbi:hypothetical protein D3C80_1176360 [compost metagenome]